MVMHRVSSNAKRVKPSLVKEQKLYSVNVNSPKSISPLPSSSITLNARRANAVSFIRKKLKNSDRLISPLPSISINEIMWHFNYDYFLNGGRPYVYVYYC